MKRLLTLALGLVALLSLSPSAVGADAEEFNPFEPDQLEANGWEERTGTTGWFGSGEEVSSWCKSADQVNENDQETLGLDQEPAQEALDDLLGKLTWKYNLEDPEQGALYCVDPESSEAEEEFLCLVPDHANLPAPTGDGGILTDEWCWDSDGEYIQGWFEDTVDTISDPVGTMVDSTLGQWITELMQGMRFYMAMALYWWILIPHADIEQSPAGTLWPPMLGLSMAIGIALVAFKGIKIMFSSKAASVLVDTLKGIASFAVWCIIGIAVISQLGHASEALTQGLLRYSLDASEIGCSRYHAEERQPDGMELEYPPAEDVIHDGMDDEQEERTRTAEETGRALGNCFASQFAVSGMFGGAIMVLFILGFLMSIVQAIILFIREAVLPILALLLPIAAAGQIGGTGTKRWLPNLLSAIAMMLLYKPMIALIFAVGFTTASLGNEFIDVIRGLVILLVGVVAPGVMLKAFKPIATQGVEDMASVGSTMNNFVMGSQAGSTLSGWARNIGAGRQARRTAANQAAHQAGGVALTATKGAGAAASTGAAAAAGPPGWAAKAVQTVGSTARKVIGFVTGNSAGPEAQAARRNPGAPGQHGTHHGSGQGLQPQQGQTGIQPPPREQAPDQHHPGAPPGAPEVPSHGQPPEQAPPGMGLREGPPPPADPGPASGAGYGPPPGAPPPPSPAGGEAPNGPNTPPPTGPNLPPPSSHPDDRSEET